MKVFLIALVLFALSEASLAGTHTWVPKKRILASGSDVIEFPTVTVTGHIDWGSGDFDSSVSDSTNLTGSGSGIGGAILAAKARAIDMANVCKNPFISNDAKQTTSATDTTNRWLAAQEVFNSIQAMSMWSMYQNAYGGGIYLIIDTKTYSGFKVAYADGSSEVWLVNPGFRTSTVKLFDNPIPDSLTPRVGGTSSCAAG